MSSSLPIFKWFDLLLSSSSLYVLNTKLPDMIYIFTVLAVFSLKSFEVLRYLNFYLFVSGVIFQNLMHEDLFSSKF